LELLGFIRENKNATILVLSLQTPSNEFGAKSKSPLKWTHGIIQFSSENLSFEHRNSFQGGARTKQINFPYPKLSFNTLGKAAKIIGKRIKIELVEM
jgi:hypothetical protein